MKLENENQTRYKQAARAGAQTDSHKGHEYPSAGVKRRVNGCTEQRRARINLRRGSREPHKRETGWQAQHQQLDTGARLHNSKAGVDSKLRWLPTACKQRQRALQTLVLLILYRITMPPAIQTSWGKVRAVQGDPKKIRWEPENGDAATETLGLWLQPGSHRARLMTMHLLCGDVEQAVITEITRLKPDVETATWNTMMLKLQPDEEKDVVQDIAPKAGARLMGIRSKYSLLDATVEVVRRVSDKGLLTTWSASIIMKDAEARAMWNMAWPKMYRDLDARSEPGDEGDPPSTANQQSSPNRREQPYVCPVSQTSCTGSDQVLQIPEAATVQQGIPEHGQHTTEPPCGSGTL